MDFGIARSLRAKGITGSGVMIGTPEYMSPEQVDGKDVDQKADIYSLGVILYEMVTGQVPFEGDTPFSIGVKQKSEIPRPPKEINDQIPENLNRIILKCMEKEKENRYQSAVELLSELTVVESGIPTTERTVPAIKTATSKEVTVTVQRRWVWAAVLFMIVAASILAFLIFKGGRSVAPKENSMLIVLPFDNEGLPADDYIVNGITREITDRLSFLQELDIIAYTSAMQAKNADKTIRQIREEFAVDYVVTGTVLYDKNSGEKGLALVSAELIKASDETQIWSDNIKSNFEDIADVQSQIAEEIVKQLDLTLLGPVREAIWAKTTENSEAYDYYLRAREHLETAWRGSPEYYAEFEKAFEMFEKATESDPSFILAQLWSSLIHSWMYRFGVDRSVERLEKSKLALDKAREIQPDLPEINIFLAYYYFWGFLDTERAEELYASVREVRPNIEMTLIAEIYAAQGKVEEAVEAYKKEISRDPLNAINYGNLGIILTQMRRYEEAETWFDRSLSLDQGNLITLLSKYINSLMWKGYTEEARTIFNLIPAGDLKDLFWILSLGDSSRNFEEALQRLNSLQLDSFEIGPLYFNKDLQYALIYHMLGKSSLKETHAESARQILENLIAKSPEESNYHSYLGFAYALLGRKEDALREGKRGVDLYPIERDAMGGPIYIFNLSDILIIIEDYEEAISHLEHLMSIPAGRNVSIASLRSRSIYDPLRNHPRFKRLLEKYSANDSKMP
jgi:TolB-like protein/Tfp pilus assembly protein PilF